MLIHVVLVKYNKTTDPDISNMVYGQDSKEEKQKKITVKSPVKIFFNGERNFNSSKNNQSCLKINIWFVWDDHTKSCHCGSDLYGAVQCDPVTNELSVLDCHCLTLEHSTEQSPFPVVGECIFNCLNFTTEVYLSAPTDCGSLNTLWTVSGWLCYASLFLLLQVHQM